MTYEYITTGDAITFIAEDDQIAFACTVMVSQGRAVCKRYEGSETIDIDSNVAITSDPNRAIESRLEGSLNKFVQQNHSEMAKCFLSFAYGTVQQRPAYDEVIASTKDPGQVKEFKQAHESDNRTSLTTSVIAAWELGDAINKQF